nr:hypothetical protein [Tanacetum cinerariifolium]
MTFKVLLHHYGRFTTPLERKFVGGMDVTADPVELENFSTDQLKLILTNCLSYDENSLTFLYMKKPNCSFDLGLVPLADAIQDNEMILTENDEFLRTIDDNMKMIIKEQVKSQVKEQVSRILPRIEQSVNAQLEAEVLTRSSHSSRTSYAVRSDEQRNLYKALVDAYEADKTILDSYGETIILKRRRDDDDQAEGPFAGSDREAKRRRESKEPKSASAPLETATRSACRVDTLTPELLAGPTFDLMKGSCTSLIELEYHLEEVYKETTNQLDWVNPEGQQYPHNLLQHLSLIPDNRVDTPMVEKSKLDEDKQGKAVDPSHYRGLAYQKARPCSQKDLLIPSWNRSSGSMLGMRSFTPETLKQLMNEEDE